MNRFDLRIQAFSRGKLQRQSVRVLGHVYQALQLTPQQQAAAMAVSFETAAERLQQLPRMFVEPDGAFLWVAQQGEAYWQLEGCLYDREHRLLYVDVLGTCPLDRFDQFLTTFDWPHAPLLFQLRQFAVFLDEPQWRRFAASS